MIYLWYVNYGTIILFSVLILLSSAKDLVTYVQFKVNQEYISNTFCVNKDKPIAMCYGSCVLQDAIIDNHTADQELPMSIQMEFTPLTYLLPELVLLDFTTLNKGVNIAPAFKENIIMKDFETDIFHPLKLPTTVS